MLNASAPSGPLRPRGRIRVSRAALARTVSAVSPATWFATLFAAPTVSLLASLANSARSAKVSPGLRAGPTRPTRCWLKPATRSTDSSGELLLHGGWTPTTKETFEESHVLKFDI